MKTKEWNDFVVKHVHTELMATELKFALDAEIREAIAEHEAAKWHKYPEEKPKEGIWVFIAYKSNLIISETMAFFADNKWHWSTDDGQEIIDSYIKIIAWCELPKYQPPKV